MSDTNVGMGMVPCKPHCRCLECQLARAEKRIAELGGAAWAVINAQRINANWLPETIQRLEDVLVRKEGE